MTTSTQISHVNLQYSHTLGRGEAYGPGFTYPVFMARGEGDLMYVLCRASEYAPQGTRITVCTVDEEYVNAFARGVPNQGPHVFNFEDGSLVWPTAPEPAAGGHPTWHCELPAVGPQGVTSGLVGDGNGKEG